MTTIYMDIANTECCGINELVDAFDCVDPKPELIIEEVCEYRNEIADKNVPFYIFSDIGDKKGGNKLASYIKKHQLGTTINTQSKINPNSGSSLRVWIWTVSNTGLKKWYKENTDTTNTNNEDEDNYLF